MILFVLIVCIIVSTGSFTWGYWQAGYEEAARWIATFGVFWLAAHWRKWKWFFAPAVFLTLFLAVFGVWYEFVPGLMFNGAVFALFAWDLTEFRQKLKLLSPREDAKGMSRRHLVRVGFLAAGAVLIAFVLGIAQ
ncbi:MAG: hypothetical protein HYZ22_09085 [Chloroflexi bacterium]|nr:hypothetical protein [Chloroflexota bacterium]